MDHVTHRSGDPNRALIPSAAPTTDLFAWSGGEIVLFAERSADRWIVARGWRHGDRLEHVRRWSFADPIRFAGQIRRLVREATHDTTEASGAFHDALNWAQSGP